VSANNRKISEVNKSITTKVKLNEKQYDMNLLIMDNIDIDLIMGTDFLNENNAKINYENQTLILNGHLIKFKVDTEEEEKKENEEEKNNIEENKKEEYKEMKLNLNMNENEMKKRSYRNIENKYNNRRNDEEKNEDYEIKEDSEEIKQESINCPEDMSSEEFELYKRYKKLINIEDCTANQYVHHINVEEIESYKMKSNPNPYCYREQENVEIQDILRVGMFRFSLDINNKINCKLKTKQ
jgi:Retroviral aspartyl protease